MVGGKTLLVFLLAAFAQSCAGDPIPYDPDISFGLPIRSLVDSLGLGASLTNALRTQCDCGSCDGVVAPAWLALVLRYGFASCGGALITDRHVLTSAHCVEGLEAAQVGVLLSAAGPRSQPLRDKPEAQAGEQLRMALRIERRSKVAVITLDRPVKFSATLSPVCLPAPADKARKLERVEVNGMALTDPRTLALTGLRRPGAVTRVNGREISFASDDGVCLAFEGWPLVRKNATSSKCELIGIQTEVNAAKTTTTKPTSRETSEESSEETTPSTTSTTLAASTTTPPAPKCLDSTEFASVAHYLSWIRGQTTDATRCAPPTSPVEEQRQRQRWRNNLRSAARAAKRKAVDQAKKKAAKKGAEKKASKKTRDKRSAKTNKARERTVKARVRGEQKAIKKSAKYQSLRSPSKLSLTSGRAPGLSLQGKMLAAKKSALAKKVIGSKTAVVSSVGTQGKTSGIGAFPSDAVLTGKTGSLATTPKSGKLLFHSDVWNQKS